MRARIRRNSCSGAHRQPVAGPDVGAEHHDVAGLQAVEQRAVRGKAGKAEERRGRIAAALAVEREFVFGDAAVDLGFRLGRRHAGEQRMRKRVVAEAVALGQFPPRDLRVRFDIAAEQEERGAHAFVLERVQNFRRGARPGSVVEGEHQLLALERQGDSEIACGRPAACCWRRPLARARCRARPDCPGRARPERPRERWRSEGGDGKACEIMAANLCANHLPIPRGRAYKRRALAFRRPRPA